MNKIITRGVIVLEGMKSNKEQYIFARVTGHNHTFGAGKGLEFN